MTAEQYEPRERQPPGPSLDDFLGDVRALLTELYDAVRSVTSLATKSNIPPVGLTLNGTTNDAIDSLLSEAQKRRKLHDLLSAMYKDYGADRPEINDYMGRLAAFEPTVSARSFSSPSVSAPSQKNSALASRTIGHRREAVAENADNGSFQEAEDAVKDLNWRLDSLQVHIDLLRDLNRIYGVANDLTWQSRRLEQVTDLQEGMTSLPVRAYRDILDPVIDAQAELENLDVDELLGRIQPVLMTDNLCIQYKDGLNANKARIEKLKSAEGNASRANELASESAWGTKDLRVFWYSFLQQLYLRLADRLREMRQALATLPR